MNWLSEIRTYAISVDPALVAEVVRQARTTRGELGHNVGGWRSSLHFSEWPSAQETIARVALTLGANQICVQSWAILHERGSYHAWHRHTGIAWRCTGVLYLTSGGAATLFRGGGVDLRITPKAGTLLTFPSGVEHATEPHDGPDPRITIAFNVP